MQVVIADWRLTVERKIDRMPVLGRAVESIVERVARRARLHQQIENERRSNESRMLAHSLKLAM